MRILVTAFDPFGGAEINPSWEAVSLLPEELDGHTVHIRQMPTVFGRSSELLLHEAEALQPDLVILCGVAQGRDALTPELIAVNYRMGSIADNAGQQYSGERIDSAAPDAYMTRLPVQAMVERLKKAGLPARLSLSAGAFVCNDLYFAALKATLPAVFIHVPGTEVLTCEQAAQGIRLCIEEALHTI